ncbi:MAG: hypothetical protein AVDCRST_MAG59-3719 [uncultured Thermomicrobiales bacterium]|uniref:Uncharacterized protein n=1 Tax=uncultured Thermomicrobiales bacterium TaxID=1645740 RepID=A0A6J4VBT9_9BACT|nr:MAG: hypothetical protein AVDCRST_MAG59-3719 [uncultured Thermomicrobiales bacterium]
MRERRPQPTSHDTVVAGAPAVLFGWCGGGIVLLGDVDDGHWILARGWFLADALTDVRRWCFADPKGFVRQVRRLVLEATGDPAEARAHSADALAWTESLTAHRWP